MSEQQGYDERRTVLVKMAYERHAFKHGGTFMQCGWPECRTVYRNLYPDDGRNELDLVTTLYAPRVSAGGVGL